MAIQSAQKKPRGGSRTAQKASKLLVGLWPSEVRAIQACQSFLRREQEGEVSLQETLEIWEGRISRKWRAEKMKIDGQMQLREIEQYQSRIQEKEGRKLDWETAAQDWIERYDVILNSELNGMFNEAPERYEVFLSLNKLLAEQFGEARVLIWRPFSRP